MIQSLNEFVDSTIICIGNGESESDLSAQNIAKLHGVKYHGILDPYTNIVPGVYHTSIYDIKLEQLKDKVTTTTKIIVLDQDISSYRSNNDYYNTIDLGHGLTDYANVEFQNPTSKSSFRQLIKKNKSFCILPFISVYQRQDVVKSCCIMERPVTTSTDFKDFATNTALNNIRDNMLNGNLAGNHCNFCYNLENQNIISPRESNTIEWAYRLNLKSFDDVKNNIKLINYDIRLNNECNLLCRSCSPANSHLIDKEYFDLKLIKKSSGFTEATSYDIIDLSVVERVYVAGGEPTINKVFFNFLSKCIAQNKTNFELIINTNASALPKEFINLISHFTNLKFEISIDGFKDLNHYIRWPVKWEKFTNNIKILQNLSRGYISFNTVASIYNAGRLFPIFNFLETNYPDVSYHVSILADEKKLQFKNFPNKEFALKDLDKIKDLKCYSRDEVFKSRINGLIEIINKSTVDQLLLQKFFEFNDKLDQSRNVWLKDFHPELEKYRIIQS